MLITIFTWFLIWFNTGVAAQALMCLFDGVINRRWPLHWNDAHHFLLAGLFGFLSMFNAIMFMIQFSMDPESFIQEEDDEETVEENLMYIGGLTEDEQKKVEEFVHGLLEARPKGEESAK